MPGVARVILLEVGAVPHRRRVVLMYSVKTFEEAAFHNELEFITANCDAVEVQYYVTQEAAGVCQGHAATVQRWASRPGAAHVGRCARGRSGGGGRLHCHAHDRRRSRPGDGGRGGGIGTLGTSGFQLRRGGGGVDRAPQNWGAGGGGGLGKSAQLTGPVIMNSGAEGAVRLFRALKMVNFFFPPNSRQTMNPLDAPIPKIPLPFFAEFWVRVTSGAGGSISVGFFFGGGGVS